MIDHQGSTGPSLVQIVEGEIEPLSKNKQTIEVKQETPDNIKKIEEMFILPEGMDPSNMTDQLFSTGTLTGLISGLTQLVQEGNKINKDHEVDAKETRTKQQMNEANQALDGMVDSVLETMQTVLEMLKKEYQNIP